MRLIHNAFLRLGISPEATTKEIARRQKEISHLCKNDENPEYEYDITFCSFKRDEHSTKEAKQSLSDAKERLVHHFFWFYLEDSKQKKIFDDFRIGGWRTAIKEWNELSDGTSLKALQSKKNYALAVCLVAQEEKVPLSYIKTALKHWKEVLESDKYWSFYEKNYLLNDDLHTSPKSFLALRDKKFLEVLEQIFKLIWKNQDEDQVMAHFAKIFSLQGEGVQNELLVPIYNKIEKLLAELENLDVSDDGILDEEEIAIIDRLKQKITEQLEALKKLNLYDSSKSKDLRDRVADALRTLTLDISNNIGEDEYAHELLAFAKEIAGSRGKTQKMDQDLMTINENIQIKPVLALLEEDKYQEALDQFSKVEDSVDKETSHAIKRRCYTSLAAKLYAKAWKDFHAKKFTDSKVKFQEVYNILSPNIGLYDFNEEVVHKYIEKMKEISTREDVDLSVFDELRKKIREIADNNFDEDSNENLVLIMLMEGEIMPLALSHLEVQKGFMTPFLFSIWFTGFTMYGKSWCFTVLLFPVFFLGRYKVEANGNSYRFFGKEKLQGWQVIWNIIALLIVGGFFLGAFAESSSTSSNYRSTSTSYNQNFNPSEQSTPSKLNNSSDQADIIVGQYRCSSYAISRANDLKPTLTLEALEAEESDLEVRSEFIKLSAKKVDETYVDETSQSSIDSYNKLVNTHNSLFNTFKNDYEAYEQKLERFNNQVDTYNNYLASNCAKAY